jgi:hypothetical protein
VNNEIAEILSQFERSVGGCNDVLTQACKYQDPIDRDRAALGVLHTRLTDMPDQVTKWRSTLWKLGLRESVNLEGSPWESLFLAGVFRTYDHDESLLRLHETLFDDLIWKLFEFREKPNTDEEL